LRELSLSEKTNDALLIRSIRSREQKPKNFPSFLLDFWRGGCGEPTKNGKEIFGFASLFQSPKRAILF